jgi:hypothetical protein
MCDFRQAGDSGAKKKPPGGGSLEALGNNCGDQRIMDVPELVTITGLSALMTRTVCV